MQIFSVSALTQIKPAVQEEQISLTRIRINELKQKLSCTSDTAIKDEAGKPSLGSGTPDFNTRSHNAPDDIQKMITLLESYIQRLRAIDAASKQSGSGHYQMPVDTVSPDEWADFDNVYQVHSPHVFIDNAIRDVRQQNYFGTRLLTSIIAIVAVLSYFAITTWN